MPALTRILVPVDFSRESRTALEYATFIGQPHGASIEVLHVWQPTLNVGEPFAVGAALDERPIAAERQAVAAQLAELIRDMDRRRIYPRLECGNTRQVLGAVAERDDFDLIVMGRGRTGISRLLASSLADVVVRRAGCPVVTVQARS